MNGYVASQERVSCVTRGLSVRISYRYSGFLPPPKYKLKLICDSIWAPHVSKGIKSIEKKSESTSKGSL